jgi:hypothetical protein
MDGEVVVQDPPNVRVSLTNLKKTTGSSVTNGD